MVLVEDAPRLGDVDRLLLGQRPRQLDQPIEPGAHHAVFGRRFRHALEPPQFLAGLLLDLLGHLGLGDGLAELGDFRVLAVGFAELALDRRHLLAQQHLALALVERRLGLPADFRREAQHLEPAGQQPRDPLDARRDVDRLQHLLLLVRRDVGVGGDEIRERAGRGHGLDGSDQLLRRLGQQLERLDRLALQVQKPGLELRGADLRLLDAVDARDQERIAAQEIHDAKALLALAHEVMRAIRRRHIAHEIGQGADAVQVERLRLRELRIALHEDADLALLANRLLGGADRARAADRDREHRPGKQHEAAHRHDDQRVRRQVGLAARSAFGVGGAKQWTFGNQPALRWR